MSDRKHGKLVESVLEILKITKRSPGKKGLFVESQGHWLIVYKPNPAPYIIVTIGGRKG